MESGSGGSGRLIIVRMVEMEDNVLNMTEEDPAVVLPENLQIQCFLFDLNTL